MTMNTLSNNRPAIYPGKEYDEEVFKEPNSFIFKWGHVLILIVVMLFLILSWIIKYPDKIKAEVVITTINPPRKIIANDRGPIKKLFVKDGQTVEVNSALAVIGNAANYFDIVELSQMIESEKNFEILIKKIAQSDFNMGDLQPDYTELINNINNYLLFHESNTAAIQLNIMQSQINQHKHLIEKKNEQLDNLIQQFALIKKDLDRQEFLFKSSMISEREFEIKKKEDLIHREGILQIEVDITEEKIKLNQLLKELEKSSGDFKEKANLNRSNMISALYNLKSEIKIWDKKFVIRSTVPGKISFFKRWSVGEFIGEGEELLTIVPALDQSIISEALIPVQNSGKVKKGQAVLVYLENYPQEEYGYLKGFVDHITLLPENEHYSLRIQFPSGLSTNTNQILPFQPNSNGTGEIITEDIRLLYRFFYAVKKAFN